MGIHILIVDDDDAVRRTLRDVFEWSKFKVSIASSAAEAERMLRVQSFDIVLTDMRMEKATSGYDVVRATKAVHPAPLVVILTAFPIPAPEWRASGADALYVKGAGVMALVEELRLMVERRRQKAS